MAHSLLDLTNTYGVAWFMPFSNRRFCLEWVFFIDAVVLASLGVVLGLILVLVTGWLPFDPICAILVASNILWMGGKLIRQSVGGLMDEADPKLDGLIHQTLDRETAARGLAYHELRYRNSGSSVWVEVHLLFPAGVAIETAHEAATAVEDALADAIPVASRIITHVEPAAQHDTLHRR